MLHDDDLFFVGDRIGWWRLRFATIDWIAEGFK